MGTDYIFVQEHGVQLQAVDKVSVISPYEALDIAQTIGVHKNEYEVKVGHAWLDYEHIIDTGYIVPVWRFEAEDVINQQGKNPSSDPENPFVWQARVLAVDYLWKFVRGGGSSFLLEKFNKNIKKISQ